MTLATTLDDLALSNSFAALPEAFYSRVKPRPLNAPWLVDADPDTAAVLGLDPSALTSPSFLQVFSGNQPLPGGDPLAAVYSGHQFGVWAGRLGDGRALLLGEVQTAHGPWEIQLKGSGLTPYSRMGDGYAVLRSSVREYLASIAMRGLGIPTTHALSLIASDDPVQRETVETAAVVARVAPSFVRFGSFEHWASRQDTERLRLLTDYVIDRYYPDCRQAPDGEPDTPAGPVLRLLREVTHRTARLMADWQSVGFCHGVMNTDNMSILGLTLDYGPFGFLDGFNAHHICNHTDSSGRYAWHVQPAVGHWNLYRLGQALMPLVNDSDALRAELDGYEAVFMEALHSRMAAKLGLTTWQDDDTDLLDGLWRIMHTDRADFTLTFRRLAGVQTEGAAATATGMPATGMPATGMPATGMPATDLPSGVPSASPLPGDEAVADLFIDRAAAHAWLATYRARLARDARPDAERAAAMNRVNPLYILRNHLAEQAIRAAEQRDPGEIQRLAALLRDPYTERPDAAAYAGLPPDWAATLSVSCSS